MTTKKVPIKKKDFSLEEFKKSKGLTTDVRFKKQEWIPLSEAFQETTGIPGIPHGHITLLRGLSDNGKTTALLEAAISAQRLGKLPVFIITELKWDWGHAREMGFEVEETTDDENGEINYIGNFIYVDRGKINSIEDVAKFIHDLLNDQDNGNLPVDIVFLWDSIGSVPCELSIRSNKNNNEWNAGAMSVQFGGGVNQRVLLSRKENKPYTNSLVCINKVWTMKPDSPMGFPKLKNKGGETMWFDASIIVTFGNITNNGTSKISAVKNGKAIEFAKRTKIQIEKNHITGLSTLGKIIVTPHGFILDDKKEIDKYKKDRSDGWLEIIGGDDGADFETVIEDEEPENVKYVISDSEVD